MNKTIISFFLFFLLYNLNAQITLKSKVNDCKNKEPLAFVNVGIEKKGIGTITDDQGYFSLVIPKEYIHDTLTISYIGYESKRLSVLNIKSIVEICFTNFDLKELVIIPKKEKILGRKNGSGNSISIFEGIGTGGEIAKQITNNKSIVVRKIGIFQKYSNCDSFKIRFNIYKAEKDKIGELINTQPIVFSSINKQGWIDYELTQSIKIAGDFFIGFEILQVYSKYKNYQFEFNGNYQFFKSNNYLREKSFAIWKKGEIDYPLRATVNYH